MLNSNTLLNQPVMKTKLIAMILGVVLALATAGTVYTQSALPIGVAHAQGRINTPSPPHDLLEFDS
jgi:hypothetical protein